MIHFHDRVGRPKHSHMHINTMTRLPLIARKDRRKESHFFLLRGWDTVHGTNWDVAYKTFQQMIESLVGETAHLVPMKFTPFQISQINKDRI